MDAEQIIDSFGFSYLCAGTFRQKGVEKGKKAETIGGENIVRAVVEHTLNKIKEDMSETATEYLQRKLEEALKERDHWKSNHDNQVRLKQAVADRPDLKERAASWKKLQADIESLSEENKVLRTAINWLDASSSCSCCDGFVCMRCKALEMVPNKK